jgi:hypothetical protein
MRRLESLAMVMFAITLAAGICAWTATPVQAQALRPPSTAATGEPTEPEKILIFRDGSTGSQWGGDDRSSATPGYPAFADRAYSYRLRTFFEFLRRFGITVPMRLRR